MPEIKIDGRSVNFTEGETILEAALGSGIDIPRLCRHPALSVSGSCRVCVVEIEGHTGLRTSCSTFAEELMVVYTKSDKVIEGRKAALEFLLSGHPAECAICDSSGDCQLQEAAFAAGCETSFDSGNKNHINRKIIPGQRILYDPAKCISCSLCSRFLEEKTGEKQLTFIHSGGETRLSLYPGKKIVNSYSLNITDICPSGALTILNEKGRAHKWELTETPTICIFCARGCNINVYTSSNEIYKIKPRVNHDVNEYWMCDKGRNLCLGEDKTGRRARGAYIRREGKLLNCSREEAVLLSARLLRDYKPEELAVLGSGYATIEENYLLAKFASEMGIKNMDFNRMVIPGSGDEFLYSDDKCPDSRGAKLAGINSGKKNDDLQWLIDDIKHRGIKGVILLEDNLPKFDSRWKEALKKLNLLIYFTPVINETVEYSDIVFATLKWEEKYGTMINEKGRIQLLRPAVKTGGEKSRDEHIKPGRRERFGSEDDRWFLNSGSFAVASWKIISLISPKPGNDLQFESEREIFNELAAKKKILSGINYSAIGLEGIIPGNSKRDKKNLKGERDV